MASAPTSISGQAGAPAGAAMAARVIFLDYLRIFAFVSVLVGHKAERALQAVMADADSPWRGAAHALWPWVQGGGVGVLVFFLVSGYVITQVLQRERTLEFLIKRVFRIYPLYLTAVLVEAAGLWALGRPTAWPELLAQALLVGDWTHARYALGGVEWTLRLEMSFYLLMALLHAGGWIRRGQGAALPWVYAALIGVLFLLGPFPTHEAWTRGYLTLYFPFLLLGSVLYLREHRVVGWGTLALFGLLVFGLHHWGLQRWQPRWLDAWFAQLALALFVALWLARRRLPTHRWVLWWSGLTYAVYLLHNWLFDWLQAAAARAGAGALAAFVLALLGLIAVCAALVRWVEQPAIGAGRRLARRAARYGKGGA